MKKAKKKVTATKKKKTTTTKRLTKAAIKKLKGGAIHVPARCASGSPVFTQPLFTNVAQRSNPRPSGGGSSSGANRARSGSGKSA